MTLNERKSLIWRTPPHSEAPFAHEVSEGFLAAACNVFVAWHMSVMRNASSHTGYPSL